MSKWSSHALQHLAFAYGQVDTSSWKMYVVMVVPKLYPLKYIR